MKGGHASANGFKHGLSLVHNQGRSTGVSGWETEAFSPNRICAAHSLGCTHSETSKLTRQLKGTDGGQHFSGSVTLHATLAKVMIPKLVLSVQHLVLIRDDDINDYDYRLDRIDFEIRHRNGNAVKNEFI